MEDTLIFDRIIFFSFHEIRSATTLLVVFGVISCSLVANTAISSEITPQVIGSLQVTICILHLWM